MAQRSISSFFGVAKAVPDVAPKRAPPSPAPSTSKPSVPKRSRKAVINDSSSEDDDPMLDAVTDSAAAPSAAADTDAQEKQGPQAMQGDDADVAVDQGEEGDDYVDGDNDEDGEGSEEAFTDQDEVEEEGDGEEGDGEEGEGEEGDGEEEDEEEEEGDDADATVTLELRRPIPSSGAASKSLLASLASNRYHPVNDAPWKAKQATPYMALARTFESIEAVSSRLAIVQMLANYFRSCIALSPDDLLPSIYLSINALGPAFEGLELGIGESLIIKAIAESCGRTTKVVKALYAKLGDLGAVAAESRATQRTMFPPPPLTVASVFRQFRAIAELSGNHSMARKVSIINKLLVSAKGPECRYIVRSLQGKLRIGLAGKSVLTAIAQAVVLTPPPGTVANTTKSLGGHAGVASRLTEVTDMLKSVYSELPSYTAIIPVLLQPDGVQTLPSKCYITPGIPVHPMLAQPTKGVTEVLDRFAKSAFTCEYKYDGERAQIHLLPDGSIHIYSRNLEDNTSKFPDIIDFLPSAVVEGVQSFILDAEAVAWDTEDKKILPFQILSTRARKTVDLKDVKVQVCIFVFDLLYLNGESLLKKTLRERRAALASSLKVIEGKLQIATAKDCTSAEEVRHWLELSVVDDCEGLMVKTLDHQATYEPSRRSYNWLKVKKDYLDGMTDTLDLVPIGAYEGKGKRTGVYGGYLLACWDEDAEEYQSICKIGTGFSDANLKAFTEFFRPHIIPDPPSYYAWGDSVKADVWFDPVVVWEVLAADLSISPVHKAAIGRVDESKGIALRFPRFKHVREDKKPEQASTAEQVAHMYTNQFSKPSATVRSSHYG